MDNPQAQIIERLKESANVLVTVSSNPSVDQLSAAIGLTLVLNKQGKHAAAVFSGAVPSTIEFLHPEKTIEKTTDSLRDFIIALDKSKADKLRYKVEDEHVKIFITPYRSSITEEDLEFSQGDLNVDTVIALGVQEQGQLDQAITAHGRILHDATIITLNTAVTGTMGGINWQDIKASSFCEMLVPVIEGVKADILDAQIATALLTGIVAETDRFSNDKTTPQTMSASAKLMAAGANQQLVATQLEPDMPEMEAPKADAPTAPAEAEPVAEASASPDPSTLAVDHNNPTYHDDGHELISPIHIDEQGELKPHDTTQPEWPTLPPVSDQDSAGQAPLPSVEPETRKRVEEPPMAGEMMSVASVDDTHLDEPPVNPLAQTSQPTPLLSHDEPTPAADTMPLPEPTPPVEPAAPASTPPTVMEEPIPDTQTLTDLEQAVQSPHLDDLIAPQPTPTDMPPPIDNARDAVAQAVSASPTQALPPLDVIGASPLDMDVQNHDPAPIEVPDLPPVPMPPLPPMPPLDAPMADPTVTDPNAPPPVPPPMMPPPSIIPGEPPISPPNSGPSNPFLPPA